jgi:hypothetical protein
MSKKLLYDLNGKNNGLFKYFLDNFKGEPRIAWYPSAGKDFRALLYLHPGFSKIKPASKEEPKSPDFFIFTDYFPHQNLNIQEEDIIFDDGKTVIIAESIEELPKLKLPLHIKIVNSPSCNFNTNRAIFLKINIDSKILGSFSFPVLIIVAENEAFCGEILVPKEASLSHIIHVRYGGGCGGGGFSAGAWILNVLHKLKCEVFVTDDTHYWQDGDENAIRIYPNLNTPEELPELERIRVIGSKSWSDHGDVNWYLVS